MSSSEDAGCENHFNTVEIEETTVSSAGVVQTYDGQLARLLEQILTDQGLAYLTSEVRDILAVVIAAQMMRMKPARTTMRSFSEQLADFLVETGFDPSRRRLSRSPETRIAGSPGTCGTPSSAGRAP